MDINDFKTFLEVNRTRHFGQAAENLCITQSTVSARIKHLEEQLGTALFVRQRNNIQLTPAGEKMLSYAETITNTWTQAKQALKTREKTALMIGGAPSLWDITLQNWLNEIYPAYPELHLNIDSQNSPTLHKRILSGSLDLVFAYDLKLHDELTITTLPAIELVLVSSQSSLSPADALKSNYLLVNWGTGFLTRHAKTFRDTQPRLNLDSGRLAINLLLSQGGAAYLPLSMVEEELHRGELFRVSNAPIFERNAYAIYRTDNPNAQVINNLISPLTQS